MFEITGMTIIGFLDKSKDRCRICDKRLDDKCPKCEILYNFPCSVKGSRYNNADQADKSFCHKHCE